MMFQVFLQQSCPATPVSLCCPHCGTHSYMSGLQGVPDAVIDQSFRAGLRYCPANGCLGLVFVVRHDAQVLVTYPHTKIDFDRSGIPERILSSFSEAVQCHAAGCYSASALMVRRTLEEICADKGAEGGNLKGRISSLRSKITVPEELLAAMDELRLLGNDAAHIEAQSYERVSSEEVEVAIEFAKELLKALYQYAGLLERLRSLKKLPEG